MHCDSRRRGHAFRAVNKRSDQSLFVIAAIANNDNDSERRCQQCRYCGLISWWTMQKEYGGFFLGMTAPYSEVVRLAAWLDSGVGWCSQLASSIGYVQS